MPQQLKKICYKGNIYLGKISDFLVQKFRLAVQWAIDERINKKV